MIKITFCLRRKPGLSRAEFHDYWRNHHAPLVKSHQAALGIRRYVQCHRCSETAADAIGAAMAGARKAPEPFDGIAELWVDSIAALTAGNDDPAARQAARDLLADEAKFIDLENSPIWLNEEHEIIGS